MSSKEATVTDPPEQAQPDQTPDDEPRGPDAERPPGPGDEELSLDVIFEVLKNQRRRLVLKYLKAEDGTVSLGELAEHVAAQENGKAVDAITSDERKRVYVGLYQCHLPKMDDMGIVSFNRNRGLVDLTDVACQLEEYLDRGGGSTTRPWYAYYGGISVLGVALAAAAVAGVEPITSSATTLLAVVALSFAACAGAHALSVAGDGDDE